MIGLLNYHIQAPLLSTDSYDRKISEVNMEDRYTCQRVKKTASKPTQYFFSRLN